MIKDSSYIYGLRQLRLHLLYPFPELETPRLKLRALTAADVAVVFQLYSDSQIMKYRGAPLFKSPENAVFLLKQWEQTITAQQGVRWGIELKSTKQLIGTAGFKQITANNFRAELGYELLPVCWRQGLMTEALKTITAWGIKELGLHTIEANIAPDNLPSRRVLEKLKFVSEGLLRENYYFEGWWNSEIFTFHETVLFQE